MADDFTVERAVNLSQLDSWADISKFQWQEIDHGIQDNLGFYLFHPKNNVLPAYVAWIAVNDVPNNALTLEFDESETTSLTPVPGLTPDPSPKGEGNFKGEGSEYFNLAGQRVAQPTKGLYIVNDKKVVIK